MPAYLSLGSNLGDRATNLELALEALVSAGFKVTRQSRIYETAPVETFPQPAFLNMVAELDGALPAPEALLVSLMEIEHSLGRTREIAMAPRTIDLDLLLYGSEIRNDEHLILPHPRFHRRRFVLQPLMEVAPNLLHPVLNKTIAELVEELEDEAEVKVWQGSGLTK